MTRDFIHARYDFAEMELIRKRMRTDFERFSGGYPTYLAHISKVIRERGEALPISSEQIQEYRTLQNFIEKGRKAHAANLRFYRAYLELSDDSRVSNAADLAALIRQGQSLQLRHYPDFLGRQLSPHNRTHVRVYTEKFGRETKLFGALNLQTADEYTRENEIVDDIRFDEIKRDMTRQAYLVFSPVQNEPFEIVHAFFINPFDAENACREFERTHKERGLSAAKETMRSSWIREYLVGFAFYDGETFDGLLCSRQNEHLVRINGFPYYNFEDDDIFTETQRGDIIPKHDPYAKAINCGDLRLENWINLSFLNLRTRVASRNLSGSYPDPSSISDLNPVFPNDINHFDPSRRHLSDSDRKRYLHRHLLDSELQLIQASPPYDHQYSYDINKTHRRRTFAFLCKIAIMNFDFKVVFDFDDVLTR